ncbi:olfactory receptor class A-like protein 1 [Ornithorhynchus anatinus]|uniref:olfactory receptor class A-like protein 1 n=1 Tax=Ornithorhynchus anatinus TaxID=9258 RepID=UPI0010A8DFDF|nr:olfactory receptor class A-like protein 1 [Ornithorhynchus anatinus]
MSPNSLAFGSLFPLQVTLGVLGNVAVLLLPAGSKPRPVDLILSHLALANAAMLLTKGVPETMAAWGRCRFLADVGCKILLYCFRVGRGLSICSTSLLSVFQALTLSPGEPRLGPLKARAPGVVLPSCFTFWALNMLLEVPNLVLVTGPPNDTTVRRVFDGVYCSSVGASPGVTLTITTLISLRDLFFIGLMSSASGYMVLLLHSHHRRVLHIHGAGRSAGATPEVRAAKRVVALVTLYVLLYGTNVVILSTLLHSKEADPLVRDLGQVLSFAFPALSPFLILSVNRRPSLSHTDAS